MSGAGDLLSDGVVEWEEEKGGQRVLDSPIKC